MKTTFSALVIYVSNYHRLFLIIKNISQSKPILVFIFKSWALSTEKKVIHVFDGKNLKSIWLVMSFTHKDRQHQTIRTNGDS